MKKMIFDDYNQNIPANQDVIGSVTTTWGHLALRNGWKKMEIHDGTKAIMSLPHGFREMSVSVDVAPTITTSSYECNNLLIDMAKRIKIRKFTPKECFQLMGVSDSDIAKIQAAGISSTQQYKMAGNSIVVPVLEGIFTQMFRQDDDACF